jgi:hypothetical protein
MVMSLPMLKKADSSLETRSVASAAAEEEEAALALLVVPLP